MTVVAVLGTGRMGSAMARALARAGHRLVLYNRTPERAADLARELDATVATEPAAAIAEADVGLTMLSDGAAVDELYRRERGILAGIHDGLVMLEMSTVEPERSRALAPEVAARGGSLVDAPVSGSVSLAEGGKLTIMAGGDADAIERARPVLDALAGRVYHLGGVGNGAAMKLAVNTTVFGLAVSLAEAIVIAERAGIERATAYEVLANSAVGAPFVGYKREAFVDPEGAPTAFSVDLAAKDLRLILGFAGGAGLALPQTAANLELFEDTARTVGGDRDFALVAEHLRGLASRPGGGGRGR